MVVIYCLIGLWVLALVLTLLFNQFFMAGERKFVRVFLKIYVDAEASHIDVGELDYFLRRVRQSIEERKIMGNNQSSLLFLRLQKEIKKCEFRKIAHKKMFPLKEVREIIYQDLFIQFRDPIISRPIVLWP